MPAGECVHLSVVLGHAIACIGEKFYAIIERRATEIDNPLGAGVLGNALYATAVNDTTILLVSESTRRFSICAQVTFLILSSIDGAYYVDATTLLPTGMTTRPPLRWMLPSARGAKRVPGTDLLAVAHAHALEIVHIGTGAVVQVIIAAAVTVVGREEAAYVTSLVYAHNTIARDANDSSRRVLHVIKKK